MRLSYSKRRITAYEHTLAQPADDPWMSLMREPAWESVDGRKAKVERDNIVLHLRPSCPYSARRLKHHTIIHHPPHTYTHSTNHVYTDTFSKMADVGATPQVEKCPASAPFFGFMGVTAAIVFASKWEGQEEGRKKRGVKRGMGMQMQREKQGVKREDGGGGDGEVYSTDLSSWVVFPLGRETDRPDA